MYECFLLNGKLLKYDKTKTVKLKDKTRHRAIHIFLPVSFLSNATKSDSSYRFVTLANYKSHHSKRQP